MPSDAVDAEAAWEALRSLRHQPPGRSARGDRRRVFGAALEQCEQLVRAAREVGYASRPILLFYAWSQAGRAIAAASPDIGNDEYRLTGHGLHVIDLAQRPPLHCLTLMDKGRGAFTQLAAILRSGSLPEGATLGEVWAAIPKLLRPPPDHHDSDYRPPLQLRGVKLDRSFGNERMTGWVLELPPGLTEPGFDKSEDRCESFFKSYPTLRASEAVSKAVWPATAVFPRLEGDYRVAGRMEWPVPDFAERSEACRALGIPTVGEPPDDFASVFAWLRTAPYLTPRDRWAYPTLGGSDLTLQPFLAWWAMLFALSMLARYEPASWARHLAVDASPDAVPLERTLNRALDVCPLLVMNAIRQVSNENGWDPHFASEPNL